MSLFQIITYDLLSPSLCNKTNFPNCQASHLDSGRRFDWIIHKLTLLIRGNMIQESKSIIVDFASDPIFMLQDFDIDWVGGLILFFRNMGYTFVHTQSNPGSGIGIAFPNKYNSNEIKIVDFLTDRCIAIRLEILNTENQEPATFWVCTTKFSEIDEDPLNERILALSDKLKDRISLDKDEPFILGGSFNFDWESDQHKLLLEKFFLKLKAVKPNGFTHKKHEEGTVFTYDHFFYSGEVKYMKSSQIKQPKDFLPNYQEPSDHLAVCSIFKIL